MQFLRENRRGKSKSLHGAHALRIALGDSGGSGGDAFGTWPTGALYFLKRGEHTFNRCFSGEGAGGEYAFLKQAADGSIWLSDFGGLRRVTGYPNPTKPLPGAEKTNKPHYNFGNFAFTPDGALWAASGLGVYRFKNVEQ
jgi:hypothetical protein